MSSKCPKCGQELDQEEYCNKCKASFKAYNRIKKDSKILYNQGLQMAQIRDLSGAITSLKTSLRLDKKNIDARNLLGLVYLEIGETVQALQQWVISKNMMANDNIANKYLKDIQENQAYLERLSSAVKRYNQALQHIQQGNDDLAAIQLKKAISLNPKFIKAIALLGLCYVKEEQPSKAQATFQKILAIDNSNFMAKKYLDSFTNQSKVSESSQADEGEGDPLNKEGKQSKYSKYMSKGFDISNASWQQIVLVLGGAVIGFALSAFLITPGQTKDLKNENNNLLESLNSLNAQYQELNSQYADESEAKKSLQSEVETIKQELQTAKAVTVEIDKIYKAADLKKANDLIGAAKILVTVDATKVTQAEIKSLYDSLVADTYNRAAMLAYNQGFSLKDSQYQQAIDNFTLSLQLAQNASYSSNALYYRGMSYLKLEDKEKAKQDFNSLIEKYPNSSKVSDARFQLTQL